jgi:YidC/Oxa1 family membrane protein insertase
MPASRSGCSVIDGTHNALLSHDLFGAALGSHWLGGPGPLSAQGAVFAAVFALMAAASWLTARLARRRTAQLAAATTPAVPTRLARASHPAGPAAAPVQAGSVARVLGWVTPFISVAIAAFVPLAAGLYLVTTAVWALGERVLLQHRSSPPAQPQAVKPRVTA